MSRGAKAGLVFMGLMFVGSLPTILGCVRAYHERSKITVGMDVSSVFIAADEWELCISSYLDDKTKEFETFDVAKEASGRVYRVPKYNKTFASKEEFLEFAEHEMSNGKAWNSQFTYFAGPIRNTYRVDFDGSGKVIKISGMGGGP